MFCINTNVSLVSLLPCCVELCSYGPRLGLMCLMIFAAHCIAWLCPALLFSALQLCYRPPWYCPALTCSAKTILSCCALPCIILPHLTSPPCTPPLPVATPYQNLPYSSLHQPHMSQLNSSQSTESAENNSPAVVPSMSWAGHHRQHCQVFQAGRHHCGHKYDMSGESIAWVAECNDYHL